MPASHSPNDRAIVFLRVAVGVFFLIFGEYKVFGTQFTLGGGFQFWINKFLADGANPPQLRLASRNPDRLPRSLRRIRHRSCIGSRHSHPTRERRRTHLHADLLFSSDYPGTKAPLWQYFGASLSHSIFALCFITFLVGHSDSLWSYTAWKSSHSR